jgi:hypothetical protein
VALAALLGVATAAASTPAIGGSSSRQVVRNCTTAELKIKSFHKGAALGNVGGYIGFTNRASRPCRLSGWPTLVAITAAGSAKTAVHRRSTMFGPRPTIKGVPVVTLRHGERADAVFAGSDIAGPGQTRCPPPYRHLRVTPPRNDGSVRLSAWITGLNAYLPACAPISVTFVVSASQLNHG